MSNLSTGESNGTKTATLKSRIQESKLQRAVSRGIYPTVQPAGVDLHYTLAIAGAGETLLVAGRRRREFFIFSLRLTPGRECGILSVEEIKS